MKSEPTCESKQLLVHLNSAGFKVKSACPLMTITRSVIALVLLAGSSALLWAGCVSDCKDTYDSAVADCKQQYDDPDDADDLEQCIQSAKDEYESCIEDCRD
jgi:hypothetical protein